MNVIRLKLLMLYGHSRDCPGGGQHDLTDPDRGYSCRKCHRTWEWDGNTLKATWKEEKDEAEQS